VIQKWRKTGTWMSWMTTEASLLIQLAIKPRRSRRFVDPSILIVGLILNWFDLELV
jgi:hypothetical protein